MSRVSEAAVRAASKALPELERLRGKRLLLTGGTGFIGTWLLEHIAHLNDQWDRACRVYVLTRAPETFARKMPHLFVRPEFVFLTGDVCSFGAPYERCDFVIHAAASASPLTKEQTPLEVGDTIVDGTRHVLEMARSWDVEGLLFLSSGAVYGTQPSTLEYVPEDYNGSPSLSDPTATYGEGKRYAETLCTVFHRVYRMPVMIARPFTFLAPYLDLHAGFASTDFLRDALRGGPLHVKGDGTTVRSYAGAADMLNMLWGTLLRGIPGRAYNVGSDHPVSILELAQVIARTGGSSLTIQLAQEPVLGKLPARYVPDMSRMRDEIGLSVTEDLGTLVQETLDWMKEYAS